jgi:streptogramin lyase
MRNARVFSVSLAMALTAAYLAVGSAWAFDGPLTEYSIPTGGSEPSAIAAGPDGDMWFTEAAGDKIGRITMTGQITEYVIPQADAQPNGIVEGPEGDLWFTETNADEIGRLVPSTGEITEYAVPTANAQPLGIALGSDGDIWFTEYAASKIAKLNPGNGQISEFGTLFGDDHPMYLASSAGTGEDMWYSGAGGSHVGYMAPTTGVAGETTVSGSKQALGIAIGSDAAIWFEAFEPTSGEDELGRFANLFATESQSPLYSNSMGQLLADSDDGFWSVGDTGNGATLARMQTEGIESDVVSGPVPANPVNCYVAGNVRSCPLDGVAFGPDQAVWFTDFSTNSIGVFPTGYAPPPAVRGPEGPAGAEGKQGAEGRPGAVGAAGPEGKQGPEAKMGTAGPGTIVIVPFQTTVTSKLVTVRYALTGAAAITLSVGSGSKATVVAHATGRVGSNSISWNRKMTGKAAKPGTYTLTLQASVGGLLAKAAERVKLRRG